MVLFVRPQVSSLSVSVDECHRARLVLEQLDELRGRCLKLLGGGADFPFAGDDPVEGFGQQRRKIFVRRVDADSTVAATGFPEFAGRVGFRDFGAEFKCEIEPQSKDRNASVVILAAAF